MSDEKMGSCLDPELPGTGLRRGADARPGPPNLKGKSQLEPSRDGETWEKAKKNPFKML